MQVQTAFNCRMDLTMEAFMLRVIQGMQQQPEEPELCRSQSAPVPYLWCKYSRVAVCPCSSTSA